MLSVVLILEGQPLTDPENISKNCRFTLYTSLRFMKTRLKMGKKSFRFVERLTFDSAKLALPPYFQYIDRSAMCAA